MGSLWDSNMSFEPLFAEGFLFMTPLVLSVGVLCLKDGGGSAVYVFYSVAYVGVPFLSYSWLSKHTSDAAALLSCEQVFNSGVSSGEKIWVMIELNGFPRNVSCYGRGSWPIRVGMDVDIKWLRGSDLSLCCILCAYCLKMAVLKT